MWFLAGGFPMVFVAVFGLMTLAGALRFAIAPGTGGAGGLLAQGAGVVLMGLAGTLVDLTVVASRVAATPALQDELAVVLLVGLGESLAPLILASGLVSASALAVGLGLRRSVPA